MAGPATFDLPRPFGPYELVRQLGVGGMAEVYIARARSVAGFEKVVALKMIHPRLSTDPEFTQLLVEEAKITAQLSHRNIVQLIDLGQVDNTHYIAMEFVDGLDLNKFITIAKLRRVNISVRVAAFIAREVCDALEHAHKKVGSDGVPLKLVHRDVSPPNILVSTSGEVKLTDFGIAKASMRVSKTGAGVVKGKYAYMAPEQAKAQPVDHRADVFALGCVLYELSCGKPVYPDAAFPIMLDRVARCVFEAPEKAKPGLPPALAKIIKTSLAAKVEDRFATARAMADAITEFLFTLPPNPEGELSALISELVDGPSTPSIPPVGSADSILDDDFDDSTKIESVAVMKSRMAPAAIQAKDAKPGFRDEPTKAFKRVDDENSPDSEPEEEPTGALKGSFEQFASKPSQNAATLAPPNRAGAQAEARVRSPGAAQKQAIGGFSTSAAPPPVPKPNRDAPTMAPPAKAGNEMPSIPRAGKAPVIAPIPTSGLGQGPGVKAPSLPGSSVPPPRPHTPQMQQRPLPLPSSNATPAPRSPSQSGMSAVRPPAPSTAPPIVYSPPPASSGPAPAGLPQAALATPGPATFTTANPVQSGPTLTPPSQPASSGAFISSLTPQPPPFQSPAPQVAASFDPFASSGAPVAMPMVDQSAREVSPLAANPKSPLMPVILAGGFALLGLLVLLVVWVLVGR